MNDLQSKIDKVGGLINFILLQKEFNDNEDIRNITIHSLYQTTQNFLFALILSENLNDLKYCKSNISTEIELSDLQTINYNFEGFLKGAFFISAFVYLENHIRQIGLHYEKDDKKINVQSITTTFKNLMSPEKVSHFSNLNEQDFKLFDFYCHLRNTMHNAGFQTKEDSAITIDDEQSIYDTKRVEIRLIKNSANNFTFDDQLLVQEQIIKLILKINSAIPEKDVIKHRFSAIGFND